MIGAFDMGDVLVRGRQNFLFHNSSMFDLAVKR